MTQETITKLIGECCERAHLSYSNLKPTQVSPGIFQFYAVEQSEHCMKNGFCRELPYYAMATGNEMKLC
jgi:hypothetical protein